MSTPTSIIYALLFLALLAQPHVLQGHVFFLSSAWAQSAATLLILVAAAATYVLHHAALRRADRRAAALHREKQLANEKLLDSFRYIGTVNRRLPLLQEVTSDVLRASTPTSRGKRAALSRLLALAVTTTARASWGHLRFVDRVSGRTLGELSLARPGSALPRAPIGNGELLASSSSPGPASEHRAFAVWTSSDQWARHQTFLILGPHVGETLDTRTLQAVLDQAHVLFAFFSTTSPATPQTRPEGSRSHVMPAPPAAHALSA